MPFSCPLEHFYFMFLAKKPYAVTGCPYNGVLVCACDDAKVRLVRLRWESWSAAEERRGASGGGGAASARQRRKDPPPRQEGPLKAERSLSLHPLGALGKRLKVNINNSGDVANWLCTRSAIRSFPRFCKMFSGSSTVGMQLPCC